jgi:phosphoesterase RecJ-like protein
MSHAGTGEPELERAAEAIEGAPSLALACHAHPDGDALGSLLAMQHLADANGKPAVSSWPEPFVVGPHYEFLPGVDQALPPTRFPERPDVMVTFDSGSLDRLGSLAPRARSAQELVVLDHHADNQRFGTINAVLTDAAATAVVVRRLAGLLGWDLTREAALCLYVGLVTDTGRFQYPNTTSEVFHLAEELSAYDLPVAAITRELFEKHRFAYVQLAAMVLARAELDADRGFVAAWVTAGDLTRYGVAFDETEGLIDLVRRTAEAEVSCVLKEAPGEGLRVSLRSVGDVDVGRIAKDLGGGGHAFMAGFTTGASIPETLGAIRELLPT